MRVASGSALAVVALAPFAAVALLQCTKPAADAGGSGGVVDAAALMASTAAVADSGASVPASSTPGALGSTTASAAPSSAPAKRPSRAECLALVKAHDDFIAAHRGGCTVDADCAAVNASCGLDGVCGATVHKSFAAGVSAKDDAYTRAGCMEVLAPSCPTCGSYGRPRCVRGTCESSP